MMPPSGFLTPPQIPNITTSEIPLITTTVFAATTFKNTPFAYRTSTSANPNPMISPAFVEANHEVLESLLRERQRQIRNEDLRTELEYSSEDYDEEREMEPRPEPNREVTPTLRLRSLVVLRQRERVVRFEEAPDREGSRLQPLTNTEGNLPPNSTLLSHNAQPFIPSILHTPTRLVSIHVNPYSQPSVGIVNGQPLNFPFQTHIGSFTGSTGSVTPFVHWIEDYPLSDGLKMPCHIGSYNGKGDPDNFLHLFEGTIRMQKWLMPVACYMFTYTLKDSARIWWNSQKACSILNYKNLKAKFRSHFSQQKKFTKTHLAILGLHEEQRISGFVHGLRTRSLVEHLFMDLLSTYKGLMEKTYTWIEAREVATNGAPNDRRENFKRLRKSSWDNSRGQKGRDRAAFPSCEWNQERKLKTSENQRVEGKKDKGTALAEAPILMIRQDESYTKNNKFEGLTSEGKEITFPLGGSNSSAPVIIKAKIFGREVSRVHMDSGSSCEVIYEHCFMKLKPPIKASNIDLKVPLIGFLGEKSWSIGEIPLEITIEDAPLTRKETLNFVIVKSDSPYNMLQGRTAM
ncbi:hypothetical protein Tco_0390236 [Tanacetum coccineum]|uniref:Retrotransposon gag domain-containing protein n=1 Tax=Tanacetum coccineum TaxID=301880 RepID=A0ABQ4XPF9_9ASTR